MSVISMNAQNAVIDNIMTRRSVRQYLDKPVEREKLQKIAECGIYAPNALNRQNWAVRIVDDKAFIDGATDIFRRLNPEMVAADANFKNMFRNAAALICVAVPDVAYAQVDAGLMGENMMLAAHSLGLGTCCLGSSARELTDNAAYKEYLDRLNLPNGFHLVYILAVGYPDVVPPVKERDRSKIQFVR